MILRVLLGEAPKNWWLPYGGVETLESYDYRGDISVIPKEHVEFLTSCSRFHEKDEFFFVHANYIPDEPLKNQPAEALRWDSLLSRMPGPHQSGRTAIVGHTSQKSGEILDVGYLRCIDTYCVGGKWLTAMDVLTGEIWQVDREGRPRKYSLR